jgi:hypothetical protein
VANSPGLAGQQPLAKALAGYAKRRDREAKAAYDFTVGLSSLRATSTAEQQQLAAIARSPKDITRLFMTLGGAAPMQSFFSPRKPDQARRPSRLPGSRARPPALRQATRR